MQELFGILISGISIFLSFVKKNIPKFVFLVNIFLADREGFEPSEESNFFNSLANCRNKPALPSIRFGGGIPI